MRLLTKQAPGQCLSRPLSLIQGLMACDFLYWPKASLAEGMSDGLLAPYH